MTSYRLVLEPRGSLKVGGYSTTQRSSSTTALDAQGLLIPASAIKGALRESAARLVRGNGGTVRGHQTPHPPGSSVDDVVGQLFGHFDVHPGKLRVGPMRPVSGAKEPLALRHHVTLDRATRQAAHQRLFDVEVTPSGCGLRFEGSLEVLTELDPEEKGLLDAAVRITDQVGGGRGHGLGVVRLEMEETPEPELEDMTEAGAVASDRETEDAIASGSILLELRACEPLQLGAGRNAGNLEQTDEHIAGSVTRGAVAAVLARTLPADSRDRVLEEVFGGPRPAVFGVGRVGGGAIPAPTTLRVPKAGAIAGGAVDRALDLTVEALGLEGASPPPDTRAAKGTWAKANTWTQLKVPRRLITRSARDPLDGRASAGQLFSIEILDPDFAEDTNLCFEVPVEGTPEQLRHIVTATREGLTVGGTRGRGLGRLELEEVRSRGDASPADRHRAWVEALVERGVERDRARSTGCVLAVGFLGVSQERLRALLDVHGLELLGGETRRHHLGGWNTRKNLPRTATGGFAMGSVFLVRVQSGGDASPALAALEAQGIGPGRADGWGRVMICHPIHLETRATSDTHQESNSATETRRPQ